MHDKGCGIFSTLIWFAAISGGAAQETAVGGLCPRTLVKLHLSLSLFKTMKLNLSQMEQKSGDLLKVIEKVQQKQDQM